MGTHEIWPGCRAVLLGSFNDLVVEEVESCAQDHPFDTVFVALAKSLPHCLFFGGFPSDADPRPPTSCSVGRRGILLDLPEFNPLRGDIVSRIGEIEHTPEGSIWVRLRNLKQGKVCGVRRGQREFVNRGKDACIRDGPLEVPGCFTTNDS